MAIKQFENFIEAPRVVRPPPENVHQYLKRSYEEYRHIYKLAKKIILIMIEYGWENGILNVRSTDEDHKAFIEVLEIIKLDVVCFLDDYIRKTFTPLVQKWLLHGISDEGGIGIARIAVFYLTQKQDNDNEYGKLGEIAYRMEAEKKA